MSNITIVRSAKILFKYMKRMVLMMIVASMLSACNTSLSRNAELAAQGAERTSTQQALARAAQEKEQQRALEEEQVRREAAADRARQDEEERRRTLEQEAERQRLVEAERLRIEVEEKQQAAALQQQIRQEELELLAAATAERDRKLIRISELENQLNDIQLEVSNSEASISALQAAIEAAEELLQVLTSEQVKYEDINESGYTRQPLAKELIIELESRRDELARQAVSQQ